MVATRANIYELANSLSKSSRMNVSKMGAGAAETVKGKKQICNQHSLGNMLGAIKKGRLRSMYKREMDTTVAANVTLLWPNATIQI